MKTIEVSRAQCETRLADAEAQLEQARNTIALQAPGPATSRAAVSSYVLAGIAAADVICGIRLGKRYNGTDHSQAARLIAEVPGAQEHRKKLTTLLNLKTKAQYAGGAVSDSTVLSAERAATALVGAARDAASR
ncbi:hypothetical protein [Aeromicrobium sp. CTD01-1L150]|uniref:hypothetical protein n=1 Tax=Aeromicrobium sp. CTD01-1L150 TaxID=3341830 RepID=UPI0035C11B2C